MYRQVLLVAAGWAAIAGSAHAQTLERTASDPRNSGGAAVLPIEDTASGSKGYTFDTMWGSGFAQGRIRDDYAQGPIRNDQGGRRSGGGPGQRFTTEQAVQVCESSIRQQAQQRFRTPNINFRGTSLDDNPGRQDWVMGMFDIRLSPGRDETYRFSCSVNFDTGQVRSAQIGTRERFAGGGRSGGGPGRRFTTQQAVQVCESSIRQQAEQRFRTRNINFRGTSLDDNPGRQDWVMGMFDVRRSPGRDETYRFSCSVNFDSGQVRSAQIGTREGYR